VPDAAPAAPDKHFATRTIQEDGAAATE
jgi:hypothetical protein